MKKDNKMLDKVLANLAYMSSKKSANSNCAWMYHQSKTPERLKNLRKF